MTTRRWGPERIANTSLAGDQSGARVAALTGGGFVVVWKDGSTAAPQVRAQRFDAQGAPAGAEILVAAASRAASGIAVTGLADGGFYVTWSETIGPLVAYVQGNIYAADGSFLRYQPVVFPFSTADGDPAMAPRAGGAAVAWEVGGGGGVALRVFDANGAGDGVRTIADQTARDPVVAVQPGSDTTAVVVRDSVSGRHIRIAFYTAGTLHTLALSPVVIAPIGDSVGPPQAAWLAGGALALAWIHEEAVFGADELSLRFTLLRPVFQDDILINFIVVATTVVVPPEFSVLTLRALVPLPAGGAVLAWDDGATGMKLQAITGRGAPMGPEYRLAAEIGQDIHIAALPDGRIAVTWTGDGDGADSDIHLQIVDPRSGRVYGTQAAETLYGHDLADDEINGLGGNDTLLGLRGNDALWGGLGDDLLDGGRGADEMYGGRGNDTYIIDSADDAVFELARQGIDTAQSGTVSLDLGLFPNVENATLTGTLPLTARGHAGANTLNGAQNSAANVLIGHGGNDTYIVGAGDTVLESAGGGIDTVQSATLSLNLASYAGVENITLTGALALKATGNAGANVIDGAQNSAANVLTGLGGNDIFIVGPGDTVVEVAGGGTDTVQSALINLALASYPGVQNLTLTGDLPLSATGDATANVLDGAQNSAANVLTGLGGDDIYILDGGDTVVEQAGGGNDTVRSGLGLITLSNFPHVENAALLGTAPSSIIGTPGDNILDGSMNSTGNALIGGFGNDTYILGPLDTITDAAGPSGGIDTVQSALISVHLPGYADMENATLTGSLALDATGNFGPNLLTGNAGANVLSGLGGGDTFIGLGGTDTLVGGAGADRFRFLAAADSAVGAGRDVIQGFTPAEGDRIDLAAIDANAALAGDQAFSFLGTAAFTGAPGQLRYSVAGADVILQGTIAGTTPAFEIRIAGLGVLAAGDLTL